MIFNQRYRSTSQQQYLLGPATAARLSAKRGGSTRKSPDPSKYILSKYVWEKKRAVSYPAAGNHRIVTIVTSKAGKHRVIREIITKHTLKHVLIARICNSISLTKPCNMFLSAMFFTSKQKQTSDQLTRVIRIYRIVH